MCAHVIARSIVCGLMVTRVACGDPPTQPLSDPRGVLLVVRGTGAAAEIYAMRPDGTERRQLTRNAVFDGAPDWSPVTPQATSGRRGDASGEYHAHRSLASR